MALPRPGCVPVLMVVDLQVGVVHQAWNATRVIANAALAVERARVQAVPVIWVQHGDEELRPDTPAWQWVPGLRPGAGEALVHKRCNSAFEGTGLDDDLARLGATHIVLAGAATNWCIRATAYAALERGYDLTLLEDAHTTENLPLGEGRQAEAEALVAELNLAMRWLAYPGRGSGVARAAEVDFSQAPRARA